MFRSNSREKKKSSCGFDYIMKHALFLFDFFSLLNISVDVVMFVCVPTLCKSRETQQKTLSDL